ncbi:hypothetical protein, partial [Phocaeicola sp.]|uniref:hypothetical protein n=1 Tax=Phocaeicola sp. TaxID=2773926 RepID=UPI003AB167A1
GMLLPRYGKLRTCLLYHTKISAEEKAYQKIPVINDFKDRNGNDIMMQQIQRNYAIHSFFIIKANINNIVCTVNTCKYSYVTIKNSRAVFAVLKPRNIIYCKAIPISHSNFPKITPEHVACNQKQFL